MNCAPGHLVGGAFAVYGTKLSLFMDIRLKRI